MWLHNDGTVWDIILSSPFLFPSNFFFRVPLYAVVLIAYCFFFWWGVKMIHMLCYILFLLPFALLHKKFSFSFTKNLLS